MIKILNLYAGIGGNRKLWGGDIEVTAVEIDKDIASIYQIHFPQDKVIVGDAHQYLLDHYKEFDFIWSSPPCQTHSGVNHFLNAQGVIRYPDMALWQEIVFLKHFYKGKYVVENVEIYYDILIEPYAIGRHFFWSNFNNYLCFNLYILILVQSLIKKEIFNIVLVNFIFIYEFIYFMQQIYFCLKLMIIIYNIINKIWKII